MTPRGWVTRFNVKARPLRSHARTIAASSIAVAGIVSLSMRHREAAQAAPKCAASNILLPVWAVQMLTGAFAEAASEFCFYPLDTLKVTCQKTGCNFPQALRLTVQQNPGLRMIRFLYNGAGTMFLAAIVIGSVWYAAYEQTIPFFNRMFSPPPVTLPLKPFPGEVPVKTDEAEPDIRAAVLAAVSASCLSAFVEGPVEFVRSRVQAGVVQQKMMGYLKAGGVQASWPFLVPYMMKSLPMDVAELTTHSFLSAQVQGNSNSNLQSIPTEVVDAALGAAAGIAAVLASAPADCVKTRIMTMQPAVGGAAVEACVRKLYISTAKEILIKQGVAGLFVGTWPRLLEQVPATTVYWVAIEACLRAMKPYTQSALA